MHVCVCVCEICKKKIAISIDCDEIYRDIILHYVLYIYMHTIITTITTTTKENASYINIIVLPIS